MVRVLVLGTGHEPLIYWAAAEQLALDVDYAPADAMIADAKYDVVLHPPERELSAVPSVCVGWSGMALSADGHPRLNREEDASVLALLKDPAEIQRRKDAARITHYANIEAGFARRLDDMADQIAELQAHILAPEPPTVVEDPKLSTQLISMVQSSPRIQLGITALLIAAAIAVGGGRVKSLVWGDAAIHLSGDTEEQPMPAPAPAAPMPTTPAATRDEGSQ